MTISSANGVATPLSPNYIINGAFDFWQRGTSFTFSGTGNYTADRFAVTSGVGGVVTATQGVFQPGEELVPGIGAQYFINLNYTTSGTGAADNGQHIEDVRNLAGQTITVSMWAKVSTGTHVVTPQAVQRFGAGGSSAEVASGATWTLTTSWQRFYSIINVPPIAGKTIGPNSSLQIRFDLGTTGVKQFQFWGLETEAGTIATSFRRNANSLHGELAACHRYHFRAPTGGLIFRYYNMRSSTGDVTGQYQLPVTMRINPVVTLILDLNDASNVSPTDIVVTNNKDIFFLRASVPSLQFVDLNSVIADAEF
jgi:hypothetical protein